jgi:hypothetical protein
MNRTFHWHRTVLPLLLACCVGPAMADSAAITALSPVKGLCGTH